MINHVTDYDCWRESETPVTVAEASHDERSHLPTVCMLACLPAWLACWCCELDNAAVVLSVGARDDGALRPTLTNPPRRAWDATLLR